MKRFIKGICIALTMVASSAYAIPTLFFDGSINYTSDSGALQVSAVLIEATDINPAPELSGSTMVFSAFFDSVESISGSCFFCAKSTKGNFIGTSDALLNDLEIFDGNGNALLTAKFQSLSLQGVNGGSIGEVTGLFNATGGSLENLFGGGDLFALELGLSSMFSSGMYYESTFTGMVDGNINGTSVSEPSLLALLCFGLLITRFARKTSI